MKMVITLTGRASVVLTAAAGLFKQVEDSGVDVGIDITQEQQPTPSKPRPQRPVLPGPQPVDQPIRKQPVSESKPLPAPTGTKLYDPGFSMRTYNLLTRARVRTAEQLASYALSQLQALSGFGLKAEQEVVAVLAARGLTLRKGLSKEVLNVRIDSLDLMVRPYNELERGRIKTVGELLSLSEDELRDKHNLNDVALANVKERLATLDLVLLPTTDTRVVYDGPIP